jgi:hypothetical protein
MLVVCRIRAGLAIVAMPHMSQGPLQFPIENVKSAVLEEFWGPFGFFAKECRRGLFIPVCFCVERHKISLPLLDLAAGASIHHD